MNEPQTWFEWRQRQGGLRRTALEADVPPPPLCKAAPDLLAACEALLDAVHEGRMTQRVLDQAEAAIAKAKGTA